MARYLNPADHHSKKITKGDKDFAKRLDFKYIKFPVKTRDIDKTEKRYILALAFLVIETKSNIQSMYQKNVVKINMLIYY